MTEGRPANPWLDWLILACLLTFALVVRLLTWPHQAIVTVDGTSYIRLAYDLLGGQDYVTVQPPGYPVMMMPLLLLTGGEGVDAARAISLLSSMVAIAAFWFLGRRWLGRWSGLALGFGMAATPLLIRTSVITMSEMPYVMLTGLAMLAAARGRYFLSGALGGLAFHVRPEGMIFVVAMVIVSGRRPRAWRGLLLGLVLAGFVPALLYNHAQSGSWSLTLKDSNLSSDTPVQNESIKRPGDPLPTDAGLMNRVRRFGDDSLKAWPRRFVAEGRNMAQAVGWPLLLMALWGLWLAIRQRHPDSPHLAAAGLAQLFLVPLFAGVAPMPRLIVPVLPSVLLLAILAMNRLQKERRRLGMAAIATVAVGWLLAAIPEARGLRLQEDGYYPELVRAGRALKGVVSSDAMIMDRKPYTAFYAGTHFQQVPFGSYHATIDAVWQMGGDFLVVDEAVAEVFRPDLMPLVKDSFTMLNESRLQPIWFDPSLQRRHTAVYRVLRPGGRPAPFDPRQLESVRQWISRVPHDPGLHVLHAEILWLAGRRGEALAEYGAAEQAGTFRTGDKVRRERLLAEISAVDSTTEER